MTTRVVLGVREITRVAEPHTEPQWLELARTLDMRALERRVAAARASSAGTTESGSDARQDGRERPGVHVPIRTEWLSGLIEKTGLSASAVTVALMSLELGGRLRYHDFVFDPV